MRVHLRVYGHLMWYLDEDEARWVELPQGATVQDLISAVQVPPAEVSVVTIGGRQQTPDTRLRDGDEVELVPVLSGG